ncbi:MAG: hypothetical protein DRJ52_02065 [Thermoprotei archaeon]|nr:MAG: hypothetical protein DRJ52_02065 [Thermoprotei archaeon]RLE99558.1 MAG: hypothetical protein DRJ63_05035 [Thermoprotei archaeon]
MKKIIHVYCPACKSRVPVEVDENILLSAKNSPLGMTGVVDIHRDHALIIYIDAHGHERGSRVYSLITPLETGKTFTIPLKYMTSLNNIKAFKLVLKDRDLVIEGYKEQIHVMIKGVLNKVELEMAFSKLSNNIYEWFNIMLKSIDETKDKIKIETLYKALQFLDYFLNYPPSESYKDFLALILSSMSVTYKVDDRAVKYYALIRNIIEKMYPHSSIDEIIKMQGKPLYEIMRYKDSLSVRELIEYLLALEKREVIKFEEIT